jgi:hypothetical protein
MKKALGKLTCAALVVTMTAGGIYIPSSAAETAEVLEDNDSLLPGEKGADTEGPVIDDSKNITNIETLADDSLDVSEEEKTEKDEDQDTALADPDKETAKEDTDKEIAAEDTDKETDKEDADKDTDSEDEEADASDAEDIGELDEDAQIGGENIDEDLASEDESSVSFSITPSYIMYGESNDNTDGALDTLFSPVYEVDGETYEIEHDTTGSVSGFETTYKFVTDRDAIEDITADSFDDLEGEDLSLIPAGTEVYVVAMATAEDMPEAIATESFTMEKRKVKLHFEVPEEAAINEKTEFEDDKLVFDKEEAEGYITVEIVENESNPEGVSTFEGDAMEIQPEELLEGGVTLDVSEVDFEQIGYQEVPMTMELGETLSDNYEIVEDLLGYVYVEETVFTIVFTAKNNGESKQFRYVLDQNYLGDGKTIPQVLSRLGKYSEVYPTMSGFIDTSNYEAIVGWKITKDATPSTYYGENLSSDFSYYDEDYLLQKRTDYYLTATIAKKASENIIVTATPSVIYCGRAHVAEQAASGKNLVNDLGISVRYTYDGNLTGETLILRYGKDYKVTYKNNTAASMRMTSNGEYEPLYTPGVDDGKRPSALITGTGVYKGFSATVYFDILPVDIGDSPVAEISGLKNSYVLKSNGTLNSKISPKVTWYRTYYNGKKSEKKSYTLKRDKDYVEKLYVYASGVWKECENSDPSGITAEGRYLYTVRGIGNFCGTAFGQKYSADFNDGREGSINPEVCSYIGTDISNCQFIVIGDASQDLANATVSVKKTQLNFQYGRRYTAADFGIKVTIGKGKDKRVLTEGTDYYVTYDGTDFPYISGRTNGVYNISTTYEVYEGGKDIIAAINLANKYDVRITAIEGNDNGIFGSKSAKSVRIKGIRIDKGWFKLNSPSLKYDGKDNNSAFRYRTSYRMKVKVVSPESLGIINGSGVSSYQSKKESIRSNAVYILHSAYNKNPGTYSSTVYPIGPGVDHDFWPQVSFKRTGISTAEAVKKGIIKVYCDAAEYNAGGALPKNIYIYLNGVANGPFNMEYNGQEVFVSDYRSGQNGYSTDVALKLTVANNTRTGNSAGLYIQGDGYVFKGKSGKFTYSVNPITVSGITIPVLHADTYVKDYGKATQNVSDGSFYAKYEPVAKPAKGQPKYKIDLYQTYYKNEADFYDGRMSLAKLSTGQYKLTLTPKGSNNYAVTVGNTKAKVITGYDFQNVKIAEDYTVYDKTAAITGATVRVNGEVYNFPEDAGKPITFTGSQIRFDKKAGDGVTKITLKDGTELGPDSFYVEYGDNVAVGKGKSGGSFTVILKMNGKGEYSSGGKATFNFTIGGLNGITF